MTQTFWQWFPRCDYTVRNICLDMLWSAFFSRSGFHDWLLFIWFLEVMTGVGNYLEKIALFIDAGFQQLSAAKVSAFSLKLKQSLFSEPNILAWVFLHMPLLWCLSYLLAFLSYKTGRFTETLYSKGLCWWLLLMWFSFIWAFCYHALTHEGVHKYS